MKKVLTFLIVYCQLSHSYSQPPPSWTSAEMYQAIKKLNVLGTVLYIAAHPDDENTRLIAWLSKDRLYRTGYLSLTRGDGGQNLISDEQGIELGLIRTQELLAARRIDGGEQFFTRAYDFGFSKNPEETFAKWDKEKVLSDVVWVIRKFQPDIIINRFPVTGEGGHGHHTASGILANEAFSAAADPNRFPEQLKYVDTWQAKRVMWNTFNFGGNNTTRDDQFKIDVGGYNPLLGKSYGEIAAESRSQHKSQGFGVPAGRGEAFEFFKATKGDQPVIDLMEGVDQGWKRVVGGEAIEKMVNEIAASFDFLHPEKSVKALVQLHKSIKNLPAGNWQKKKLAETEQLIQQCSGLFIDATAAEQFAVVTDSLRINFSFNNRLGTDVVLKKVSIRAAQQTDSIFSLPLGKNRNFNYAKTYYVDPQTRLTQPYWLEKKMEEGYFNVSDQASIGQPDVDASIFLTAAMVIEGQELLFEKPVKYKFTDPVRGELYQPLVVLPSATAIPQTRLIVKSKKETKNFEVDMLSLTRQSFGGPGTGKSTIPEKKYLGEAGQTVAMQKGQRKMWSFNTDTSTRDMTYTFYVRDPGEILQERHEIKHDHIPNINYFTDASVTVKSIDVKTHNKKIGYIAGAGDKVPEALEQMGYDVNMLTDKELSKNGLDKFDCIITGVRAYNTNEWLNKHYDKLMKYVQEGGNLIVQYNTSNQIGPVRAKIGPYQFNITRTRVTDENAAVTLLKPEHPAFNFPNKITPDDFNGWIQERSIYHASDTTGKFEKLIAMSDPGEKSDDGSLIVTRYGKGWFTYTGIVFFRELPAGVNGAYRLLANLIALNKKKGF